MIDFNDILLPIDEWPDDLKALSDLAFNNEGHDEWCRKMEARLKELAETGEADENFFA